MTWPPLDYLSLDELFSRVGSERYGRNWTGEELKFVSDLPPDYWHPEEQGFEVAQFTDWFSPEYPVISAIEQYKEVARNILLWCDFGRFYAFLTHDNGLMTDIDIQQINSDAFKGMIYHPQTPNRERLRFLCNDDATTATEGASHAEGAACAPDECAERQELSKDVGIAEVVARLSKRKVRTQMKLAMYETWFQLVSKYLVKEDGTRRKKLEDIAAKIARDDAAKDPQTGKPPKWTSVVRRLNDHYPGWAKKMAAISGKKFLPALSC
jgi:hypothetical protein